MPWPNREDGRDGWLEEAQGFFAVTALTFRWTGHDAPAIAAEAIVLALEWIKRR